MEAIKKYCLDYDIDVILPGDVSASSFLHKFRHDFEKFNVLPTMSQEDLKEIDNKWTFAKRLMDANLPTPKTILIENETDLDQREIEDVVGFPLIVKPLYGESGHGVLKMDSFDKLKEHVVGDAAYSEPPLIIQSFIDGTDVDSSFIADQGDIKTVAVQLWINEDTLRFEENDKVIELSHQIVDLFGYCGAGHIDMRVQNGTGDVFAIELNPRFWFTVTPAMWQGLNFVEAAVQYCLKNSFQKDGAEGDIRLPGTVLKTLMKRPWKYFDFSTQERKSLWQPILDPMPYFAKFMKNR